MGDKETTGIRTSSSQKRGCVITLWKLSEMIYQPKDTARLCMQIHILTHKPEKHMLHWKAGRLRVLVLYSKSRLKSVYSRILTSAHKTDIKRTARRKAEKSWRMVKTKCNMRTSREDKETDDWWCVPRVYWPRTLTYYCLILSPGLNHTYTR